MSSLICPLKAVSVSRVVQQHGDKLRGAFTVITRRTVRIRSELQLRNPCIASYSVLVAYLLRSLRPIQPQESKGNL
jgi:hypothetical protein